MRDNKIPKKKLIWTNAQIQTTITTPETNAYGVESSRKSQNDSSNAEKRIQLVSEINIYNIILILKT